MKTDLFSIGSFTVHGYGLMIGIGFILAMLLAEYRAKKLGLREESIIDITIIAGVSGFLGAKLLYIIVEFDTFIKDPKAVLGSAGFVVYGGIIAGVLCCMLYCRIKKVSFIEYFDLVMPAVALAQGFGRIGCFFAGCCYGKATDSWFGITFTHSDYAPNGVKLIPTQLISSAGDFMICLMLLAYAKRKPRKGRVASLYLMFYGIGRFGVEFLRSDYRGSVGFLSTSQFISIGIVAAGIILYQMLPRIYEDAKKAE